METDGSLPRLQVPATCPYPKPDQSSQFNDTSDYHSASKFSAADSMLKIKLSHITRNANFNLLNPSGFFMYHQV
jgi:hypothetical protein